MKTLRRLSIAALLALLTTNLVGTPAWAETGSCITNDSATGLPTITGSFTITDNKVTGHTNCSGTAIIRNGVTEIGNQAFLYANLTSVTIPSSVISIGSDAFLYHSNLTSVNFEGDAPTVGDFAFNYISQDAVANIGPSAKLFGTGPSWNGLRVLRSGAVACTAGTLTIANNVVTGHTGCAGIAIIPAGVTSIGKDALAFNTTLSSMTIPSSVTSIGYRAFYGTTALETVTFEDGSLLPSIGTEAFYGASGLKSIIIPSTVASIGYRAFFGTTSLETVTFEAGSSLSSIGPNAFEEARGLKSIIIPSSVASIGYAAFAVASSLETVTFEAGGITKSIGDFAFIFATSLESIVIPSTVVSFGVSAFEGTSSLKTVTFDGDAPSVGDFVFWGAAASAVANVGSLAEGFGDGQTWAGLTIARASATPSPAAVTEPALYSGPLLTNYSDRTPLIGDEVKITGIRLNLVISCTIDGIDAAISNQSADSFTIVIPSGIESGLKNLVIASSAGTLTVQDALTVSAAAEDSSEPVSAVSAKGWTKRLSASSAKIYARDVVGSGKVQIFFNGKEIAWVNATTESDPKLRAANDSHYLVRTVELVKGQKNTFEVHVDGIRIKRAAYSH